MLAYLALKHDLLQDNVFSFLNLVGDEQHVVHSIYEYTNDLPESKICAKKIVDMIPYEIDTQHLDSEAIRSFGSDNNLKEVFLGTYIHLISETLFEEGDPKNPFFSEKTFRPIQNLQPFLFAGNAYSLKLLKELGFKTFAPFIDERYDEVEDHVQRMKMLEGEILRLKNMDLAEIHAWYYSITDILLWNQNHLLTFAKSNPFDQVVSDINKFYEIQ